jgi:hypothetical protein
VVGKEPPKKPEFIHGERYIGASTVIDWEKPGIDWITKGIDPDKNKNQAHHRTIRQQRHTAPLCSA